MYKNNIKNLVLALSQKDLLDLQGLDSGKISVESLSFFANCCRQSQVDSLTDAILNKNDPLSLARSMGLFDCSPVICDNHLVLGIDKWVSLDKDGYFQVCSTPSCKSPLYKSFTSTSCLIQNADQFSQDALISKSEVISFALYLNALSALFKFYDRTMEMLYTESGRDLFNQFIKNCVYELYPDSDLRILGVTELLQSISKWHLKTFPVIADRGSIDIALTENSSTIGIIQLSNQSVSVIFADSFFNNTYTFHIPKWFRAQCSDRMSIYKSFVEFMLMYSGFELSTESFSQNSTSRSDKNQIIYECPRKASNISELFDLMDQNSHAILSKDVHTDIFSQ